LRGSVTLTADGAMVGTPKYVAPEYVETGECDHRGDIYALGVIGYELLSGGPPFTSDSRVALMMERLKKDPEDLALRVPGCNPDLVKVIKKAMCIDVTERYQHAWQLEHDLTQVSLGKPPDIVNGNPLPASDPHVDGRRTALVETTFNACLISEFIPRPPHPGSRDAGRKREQRLITAVAGLCVALLIVSAGVQARMFNIPGLSWGRDPFENLPLGEYSGILNGVFASSAVTALHLWRTRAGTYALIGRSHCRVAQVDSAGVFSCGDLKLQLTETEVDHTSARGVIRELDWGVAGEWRVTPHVE